MLNWTQGQIYFPLPHKYLCYIWLNTDFVWVFRKIKYSKRPCNCCEQPKLETNSGNAEHFTRNLPSFFFPLASVNTVIPKWRTKIYPTIRCFFEPRCVWTSAGHLGAFHGSYQTHWHIHRITVRHFLLFKSAVNIFMVWPWGERSCFFKNRPCSKLFLRNLCTGVSPLYLCYKPISCHEKFLKILIFWMLTPNKLWVVSQK
jgi:hypothetical protein